MIVERLTPDSTDYAELLFHWHRYCIAADFARGRKVIDLGSGEGYGSYYMSQFAESVTGVDIDPHAVEDARLKYKRDNLTYLEGSADKIPCGDHSFDLFVSYETIEHIEKEMQKKFLHEIKRVLKPGGMLIISTPDKQRTDEFEEKNPYHPEEFYLEDFKDFLKGYFKNINISFQEKNLASLVWHPREFGDNSLFKEYRVDCASGESFPTHRNLERFLYVIALCSDELDVSKFTISSLCHRVFRKPDEEIWGQMVDLVGKYERLKEENREMRKSLEVWKDYEEYLKIPEGFFWDSIKKTFRFLLENPGELKKKLKK